MSTRKTKKEFLKDVDAETIPNNIDKKDKRTRKQNKKTNQTNNISPRKEYHTNEIEEMIREEKMKSSRQIHEQAELEIENNRPEEEQGCRPDDEVENDIEEKKRADEAEKEIRNRFEIKEKSQDKEDDSEREFRRSTMGRMDEDESDLESDKESFLYIKGKETDITHVSAFRAMHQIEDALRRKPTVTKVNRCLRVTCQTHEEKIRLKELRYIVGHAVEVTEPFSNATRATQSNRGIIFGIDDDVTDDEISMEIGIRAERIIKRRGETRIPTAQVILHVEGPLPEFVRFGWKRHRVSVYIPPPTRCYRCQRFGHIAGNCGSRKDRCPICAGPHPYQECQIKDTHRSENKASCPNCRGPHPASYQGCPAYKQAKICKKIQTNEGISYAAAVKKHKADQLATKDQEAGNADKPDDFISRSQVNTVPQNNQTRKVDSDPGRKQTAAPSTESKGNTRNEQQPIEKICTSLLDFLSKFTAAITNNSSSDDLRTNFQQLAASLANSISTLTQLLHQNRNQQPPNTPINHG